ncbi:hypothetical protein [Novosphingobium sp.]|uniref:TadE/TadG family type IV pilus assembly protein n=1 Tax=Novosphingobium sp. TaxID=1874826 RepID=UPI0025DDE0B0|nr:hypothetical protein [Novosphingobium sp.]MCC6925566.1 hypothetical protein [Novosphingobium sp.]
MSKSRLLRSLANSRSGVAMTEFALGAPFLLMAGLWGAEEANFALTTMKINQLAIHIADNASRIGDTSTLQDRKIYESDINEVIYGAQLQGGVGIDLYAFGRVFISSVQVDPAAGNQYIDWQRCRGAKPVGSSYGDANDNLGTAGIGPTGEEVLAMPDDAVIFVEINYTYQPLISHRFLGRPDIRSIASFTVRDDRDLTQIYQRDPASPDPVQSCSSYAGRMVVGSDGSISDGGSSSGSSSTTTSSGSSSTTTSSGGSSSTTSSGGSSTSTGGSSTTSGGSSTTSGGSSSSGGSSGGASSGGASSGGASGGGASSGGASSSGGRP